jgi:DNA-binding PadR family transcriptional regulator
LRPIDTKLETELKRGIFQIAVLHLLQEPLYGYQIGRMLGERGLSVEEGTLYPLLRRMEEQELLESWWVTEQARPRKYYRTTGEGRQSLRVLVEVWERVDGSLRRILEAAPGAGPPQQGGGDPGAGDAPQPPGTGAGADDA